MDKDPALDDAIEKAAEHTAEAQNDLARSIEEPVALPHKAERVIRRAEDLHVLSEEAAGDPDASG